MSDYLRGRVSNVSELIEDKADLVSKEVHDLQRGTAKKSLNAVLDEADNDPAIRALKDEQKDKFIKGFVQTLSDRGVQLAAELGKEDFDQIDTAPKNGQMQKCELDAFASKERLHSGLIKSVAIDLLQKEAQDFAPGRDKCACDYPMASKSDIDSYEIRQKARILKNPYFSALCSDAKVFSELAQGTDGLDHNHVQADMGRSQDLYCRKGRELYELGDKQDHLMSEYEKKETAGNVSEQDRLAYDKAMSKFEKEKAVYQVSIDDLSKRRLAEIFLLENWDQIKDTTGGINQTGLANYAQTIAREAQNDQPSKPAAATTGR